MIGSSLARVLVPALLAASALSAAAQAPRTDTLRIAELTQPVEVLRDRWGLP